MTDTTALEITHVEASQAQKEVTVNEALEILDAAVADQIVIDFPSNANYSLTTTGTPAQWQYAAIRMDDTGTLLTTSRDVIWPDVPRRGAFIFSNNTARTLTLKRSGQTGVSCSAGERRLVRDNGTDIVVASHISNAALSPMAANTVKGNATASSAAPTDIAMGTHSVLIRAASNITAQAVAANQFLARASTGDLGAKTITDNGLSLLAAANYAAMRTLLGIDDAMIFRGVQDCSANPNYPAADRGDVYKVSVAGKIGGASGPNVEAGDTLYCITDGTLTGDHAAAGANWVIAQVNVDGAVTGPASAVSGNVSTFNGTGGKVIQDSGVAASDILVKSGNLAGLASPIDALYNTVPRYAWASRPAAASYSGRIIQITDIGFGGSLFISDGTYWRPLSGSVLVGRGNTGSSVTGTLTETTLATVTLPAGIMAANGAVVVDTSWTVTNSANNKTPRVRFGGAAGTIFKGSILTTSATWRSTVRIINRNATNSQIGGGAAAVANDFATSSAALPTASVDTTATVDVVLSGTLADIGENITLESYSVKVEA